MHLFTASGAVFAVLALVCIAQHQFIQSFWYMFITIFIDAVDGTLARLVDIKQLVPIDGALLDNVIDYSTYVIVPCFFLWESDLLPTEFRLAGVVLVVMASCYQFTQINAKTADHFFTGFPSYWNLLVFFLFYYHVAPSNNVAIIIVLFIFSFIPIKYMYPSRMTYVSGVKSIRRLLFTLTILWAAASLFLLATYPKQHTIITQYIVLYAFIYVGVSLYRTWKPLKIN